MRRGKGKGNERYHHHDDGREGTGHRDENVNQKKNSRTAWSQRRDNQTCSSCSYGTRYLLFTLLGLFLHSTKTKVKTGRGSISSMRKACKSERPSTKRTVRMVRRLRKHKTAGQTHKKDARKYKKRSRKTYVCLLR